MNAVRSYNVSLKYQRSTSSGCKDIGITKIEFVAKTQFLSNKFLFFFILSTSQKETKVHTLNYKSKK